jgi:alkanesulfonate monooxygenase SsuD/methylene tetrahydromethanopterin reductase-like flavin-dependent oxidoreductase (luciferase family)
MAGLSRQPARTVQPPLLSFKLPDGRSADVGILLPTREALIFGDSDPEPLLELAARAESLGFASVWVGESLLARPRFEPLTLLAAVAARTSTVAIGTAVLLPALHQAVPLAQTAATLDRISHGRLILGVGAAAPLPATAAELDEVGVRLDDRVRRMLGNIARCKALWAGQDPRGVDLLPKPHRPNGPPVWLGAAGPRMLERAGRAFDGWFPISPDAESFAVGLAEVRRAATAAGRKSADVKTAVYLNVTLDDDAAVALAEQRRYMEAYYGAPYEVLKTQQGCCAGTAVSVRNWIAGYVAAGAEHVVIRLTTAADHLTQLDRLHSLLTG